MFDDISKNNERHFCLSTIKKTINAIRIHPHPDYDDNEINNAAYYLENNTNNSFHFNNARIDILYDIFSAAEAEIESTDSDIDISYTLEFLKTKFLSCIWDSVSLNTDNYGSSLLCYNFFLNMFYNSERCFRLILDTLFSLKKFFQVRYFIWLSDRTKKSWYLNFDFEDIKFSENDIELRNKIWQSLGVANDQELINLFVGNATSEIVLNDSLLNLIFVNKESIDSVKLLVAIEK